MRGGADAPLHSPERALRKIMALPCSAPRGSLCGADSPCTHLLGAPPQAPGDFLMRRKSPKTHQGPPGSWTSGEGGVAPFDPPALCPSGIGCDSLNPQASSKPRHLPCHGLTAGSVTLKKPEEKSKTDLPTNSKWQIGLFLWQKVARVQAQRSTKEGEGSAPRESRTVGSGAPLVTFPAAGKSPGVEGRSALLVGAGAASPA